VRSERERESSVPIILRGVSQNSSFLEYLDIDYLPKAFFLSRLFIHSSLIFTVFIIWLDDITRNSL
jgi:hypothetical protein